MHDEPDDRTARARPPRDLVSRGGGRTPAAAVSEDGRGAAVDRVPGPGVVDWGASPWVGPTVTDAAQDPAAAGRPAARGPRAGRRRADLSQDAAGPGDARTGRAEDTGDTAPGSGRSGRRKRGEPRPELPAPSTRRPAEGSVGRRTVSRRPARDLTPDDDPVEVARQVCLDQLSYTARTRAELAAVLDKRGVPADVAEQVLGRFTEVGLIDDVAFAGAWVARRSAGKGLARRALAQELRQRGVDDATAAAALEGLAPDQELEQARALVDRRLASTAGVEPAARVRRLVGMLARKGYPSGLAYRVVRDALAAECVDVEE